MIAVCVKWVGELVPGGLSDADRAAIEMALRHAHAVGTTVLAVTAGGAAADEGLRLALACGAATALRVDAPDELDSADVAAALAPVVANASAVWCGDMSLDCGTGSVPAFLAAHLGWQQALGLVAIELEQRPRATRRLDGGRREIVRLTGPAVLSVEGSIARLRRAALRPALTARATEVLTVLPYGLERSPERHPAHVQPFRPRARVLPAPTGNVLERVHALTEAAARRHGETVRPATAGAAAERILRALAEWGYLVTARQPQR